MHNSGSLIPKKSLVGKLALALVIMSFYSCKPEGYINTVKYEGEKYVNDCTSFQEDAEKVIKANFSPKKLMVSKYNNSDKDYYYLEAGQFEILNDMLNFRLAKDFDYETLLFKGVAVSVNLSYKALDEVKSLETDAEGEIGSLLIDRQYFVQHGKPFFYYSMPLNGIELTGKQLYISFGIAKYKSNGDLKKVFCETDKTPFGIAEPACCNYQSWVGTHLQSLPNFPAIPAHQEQFKYGGFTGTIDVHFEESSYKIDDSAFAALTVQAYVEKYKNFGYKISAVDIVGYASPGGKEAYNLKLSENRANALNEGLKVLNGNIEGLEITSAGGGEDWARVRELTLTSSLDANQQAQTITIIDDDSLSLDEKEAKMRPLPFWEVLVPEVLIPARHTFATLQFAYDGELPALRPTDAPLPVASAELEQVAGKVFVVKAYSPGTDVTSDMKTINEVLTQKASPNLYAVRATYHNANKDYDMVLKDLETADKLSSGGSQYGKAAKGYQVLIADQYDYDTRRELYDDFSEMAQNNRGDKELFFNRAILMDKIGYLSGALNEYDALLEGNEPTAANLNNRGVAKLRSNMFSEAQVDFEAAIAKNAQMPQAHYNLAVISAYRGLPPATIEHLDHAIAIDPSYKNLIFSNPAFAVMAGDPRFDKYK